jgi:3-hydroxymyristoyl/3-hydroxydecanoyl-(acyl carrier protein) dehydratase
MKVVQAYAHGHPATEGHFAGHAIIPGVIILRDVLQVIRAHAAALSLAPAAMQTGYEVRAAKFLRPVLPGEEMVIALRAAAVEGASAVHFDCTVNDQPAARGTFTFHG